jgi:hypothetical protein
MKPEYQIDFHIGNKVKIIPLGRDGKVISIWITAKGITYEVRYFDNAEAKNIYFYSDELEFVQENI